LHGERLDSILSRKFGGKVFGGFGGGVGRVVDDDVAAFAG